MATPISPRSLSPSQQTPAGKEFDPIAYQIEVLKARAVDKTTDTKQLRSAYENTIKLCLKLNKENEAIDLLNGAETDQIFAGAPPTTRAHLYSTVICGLIENGSHAKGLQVYKSSITFGVWGDNPLHEQVKKALTGAGFSV